MASLLNMSGGSLLKKGLPYDAEIEYLQSSGTQYIDTGIVPLKNWVLQYDVTASQVEIKNQNIVGFYTSYYNCSRIYTQNNSIYVSYIHSENKYGNWKEKINQDIVNIRSNIDGGIWVNGVLKSTQFADAALTKNSSYPIYLFGASNNLQDFFAGRIYSCKIYNNYTIIGDFIPVRVGQVGYMYDKVSGQLFGNNGTGAFILGPDKTN